MQYKTIVHRLLQQRPQLAEQLREKRMMMEMLDLYSWELKASHEAWKESLAKASPDSDETQIASEALEIALKELAERLPSETSPKEGAEPLSLDAAMGYVRRHTPPA